MAGIYIFSEKKDIAGSLIAAAKGIGAEINVFSFCKEDTEELLAYGAAKVLQVNAVERIENYAKAMAGYLKENEAELFMVGSTATGREVAASVAAYADAGMVSDVSSVTKEDGAYVVESTLYSGLVVQKEKFDGFGVVTAGRGLASPENVSPTGVAEEITLEADSRVNQVKLGEIERSGSDLSAAEKIVSIGMGTEETDIATARQIAELVGAELACSRDVAEQRHWLPLDHYVGISGVSVTPDLYLAIAISGQMQHIFGMRDSKIIAAINKDEQAKIFENADYGIVGDIHEIMPLLIEGLKARQG
jgi:electron transfer flavoprotein alpha subunit